MRNLLTCLALAGASAFAAIAPMAFAQQPGSTATIIITNEDVDTVDETVQLEPAPDDDSIVITGQDMEQLAEIDSQMTEDEAAIAADPITIPVTPTPEPTPQPTEAPPMVRVPVEPAFTVNGRPGYTANMAVIVNPEEEIRIEPWTPDSGALGQLSPPAQLSLAPKVYSISQHDTLTWSVSAGRIIRFTERGIIWESPLRSGTETIELKWNLARALEDQTTPETRRELQNTSQQNANRLQVLICYPFNPMEQTSIEGYPIGVYADPNMPEVEQLSPFVAENKERYKPPQWFVKVDSNSVGLKVSPNFRLGDFSPAMERGKTHFIVLDYRLIDRLEALIKKIQDKHPNVKGLTILRAYLTPNHRDMIRRRGVDITTFSRYLYGDAAVFIVDADGNGVMDDLNGDGISDIADAEWIENLIGELERESGVYGGVGVLDKFTGPEHEIATPCVMIDTRGVRSRWRVSE